MLDFVTSMKSMLLQRFGNLKNDRHPGLNGRVGRFGMG